MTVIQTRRPPAPDSPELAGILAEIAADARRRREQGDRSGPLRGLALVREHLLGAVQLPIAEGGAGYSSRQYFELIIRLAEADSDLPHILRSHFGGGTGSLSTSAGRLRRQQILDGVIFAGAQAEPTTPPGTYDYDTKLVTDGENFRLKGKKFYTTGALYADFLSVAAHDENGKKVNCSIPARREGVRHLDDWDGIGQRETASGTIVLDNVLVYPDEVGENTRAEIDDGPARQRAQAGTSSAHLFLHAVGAGNLRALVTETANMLRDRKRAYSWGNTPEARHDPQLLAVIGELAATSFMVDAAILAAADMMERSLQYVRNHGEVNEVLERAARVAVAKVKVAVEPVSLAAAGHAYDAGGASWVRESAHLQRFWLNMRTLYSHNPTVYKARVIGDVIVNDGALPPTFF